MTSSPPLESAEGRRSSKYTAKAQARHGESVRVFGGRGMRVRQSGTATVRPLGLWSNSEILAFRPKLTAPGG